MRKICVALLVLSLLPQFAGAAEECSDRPECWPVGSSMHEGLVLVQRLNATDKILMAKHDELVNLVSASSTQDIKVDERLLVALKRQQSAWLKYRSDECELTGSLTGAGGTWPSTYANKCEVNLADQRLRRVRSAIRCVEKIPRTDRLFKQGECLQPLVPLTNSK
jgi:uncharacterized protein YecT (DUF1311 family)